MNRFRRKKAMQEIKNEEGLEVPDSAIALCEFLKPGRFVSEHTLYRALTPVYTAAFFIFIVIYNYYRQSDSFVLTLFETAAVLSAFIAYTSIPRFLATRWRDYPYYLAKAHFVLSEKETAIVIRLRRFIEGLEAYNIFLQRNLKIKIKDFQSF
jgi:hypothetical protein